MRKNITENEASVLNCVKEFINKKGYAPTTQNIRKLLNQSSAINYYYVCNLIKKGYLKRDKKDWSVLLILEVE